MYIGLEKRGEEKNIGNFEKRHWLKAILMATENVARPNLNDCILTEPSNRAMDRSNA
jgi:hypothetical protein